MSPRDGNLRLPVLAPESGFDPGNDVTVSSLEPKQSYQSRVSGVQHVEIDEMVQETDRAVCASIGPLAFDNSQQSAEILNLIDRLKSPFFRDCPQVRAKMVFLNSDDVEDLAMQLGNDGLRVFMKTLEGDLREREDLLFSLADSLPGHSEIHLLNQYGETLDSVLEKSNQLTNYELRLLLDSIKYENLSLFLKILERKFSLQPGEIAGGKEMQAIFYPGNRLGKGGLNQVHECVFTYLDKEGNVSDIGSNIQLGAIKIPYFKKDADPEVVTKRRACRSVTAQVEADVNRKIMNYDNHNDHLLKVHFVGTGEFPAIIFDKVFAAPGLDSTNLVDLLHQIPVEDALMYLAQGIRGIAQNCTQGLIDTDVKLGNILVGSVVRHGPIQAFSSDHAFVQLQDVQTLHTSFSKKDDFSSLRFYQKIPDEKGIYKPFQITATPKYIGRTHEAFYLLKKHILEHGIEDVPLDRFEMPVKALLAEAVDTLRHTYNKYFLAMFPPGCDRETLFNQPLADLSRKMSTVFNSASVDFMTLAQVSDELLRLAQNMREVREKTEDFSPIDFPRLDSEKTDMIVGDQGEVTVDHVPNM